MAIGFGGLEFFEKYFVKRGVNPECTERGIGAKLKGERSCGDGFGIDNIRKLCYNFIEVNF